jgi:hypothetical protein
MFGSNYAWSGEGILICTFTVSDNLLAKGLTLIAENNNQYSLWYEDENFYRAVLALPQKTPCLT